MPDKNKKFTTVKRTQRPHSTEAVPRRTIVNPFVSIKAKEPLEVKVSCSPINDNSDGSSRFSRSISFRLNSTPSTPSTPTRNEIEQSFKSEIYWNCNLANQIARLPTKVHVDLSHWHLIDQDIPLIIKEIIVDRQCAELWLYDNQLTSHGASLLALGLINNTTLKSIDLSFNQISDLGVWALTQMLLPSRYSSITILYLTKNGITDQGAKYLADILTTNQTLAELWLSNNQISNYGVKSLAQAMATRNRTLKFLSLSMNPLITDQCIDVLMDMLAKTSTLKKLWMKDCNLNETAKSQLRTYAASRGRAKIEL
jgi:hypothetical protein